MDDNIGKPERATQDRIIKVFRDGLGYEYLGDWKERENNSNIEKEFLVSHLKSSGYNRHQINHAIHKLKSEADVHGRSLYGNNKAVYALIRYGVRVAPEIGSPKETIKFINFKEPEKNHFAIAEEVTLKGGHERRPDLVLYINGIALAVLELKNSRVSIADGIRQGLSNQKSEFNAWFFSTVQFVFAGNDSEGLRYATIGTPEKKFYSWKEDEKDNAQYKLDKYLIKICNKGRLLELVHDFVVFDGGIKKLPRVHQYFGVKAAQEYVKRKEGGIIWHTQGSGKSLVMVFLAKWILEDNPNARVTIITDRTELDKQIEGVFGDVGEEISRTKSCKDLVEQLERPAPRLLCSLIQKAGHGDDDPIFQYTLGTDIQESKAVGEIFVFIDECHRTQSGKLHKALRGLMPEAAFIGFTGTPLLKKDKATSMEVFGRYIHTYMFKEAVKDKVILDLVYEARDIDQTLGSEDRVDAWFEAKTRPLNEWQKDELKKKWGTMKKVLSARSRMDRIVGDIIFDFGVKPRLSSNRGTAMLVASSIYEACKYFSIFSKTPFRDYVGIVTSYGPHAQDITREEMGADSETDKQFVYRLYEGLLKKIVPKAGKSKTETYEDDVKKLFIDEPANMKLLIVVNKLLTGFDAPSCTYLYIDKSMSDHGLFQAICRTNRLDGEDKSFGHIVDYKDLFKNLINEKGTGSLQVYSSDLDDTIEEEPEILIQRRLEKWKMKLEEAIETTEAVCEPVVGDGELEYIHYFCGNTEIQTDLQERSPLRSALYKSVATLVRSYTNINGEMVAAGYSVQEEREIRNTVKKYIHLRDVVKRASGEILDLKAYESDMRHLIDTYIQAEEPRKISRFEEMPLLDVITKLGIDKAIDTCLSPLGDNTNSVSESIENNIRKKIVSERPNNPEFYDRMSEILDEVIGERRSKALEYAVYLERIQKLVNKVNKGFEEGLPEELDTSGKRSLYDNLGKDLTMALKIHQSVKKKAPDNFRGNQAKEAVVKQAIYEILSGEAEVEKIFAIICAHEEYWNG